MDAIYIRLLDLSSLPNRSHEDGEFILTKTKHDIFDELNVLPGPREEQRELFICHPVDRVRAIVCTVDDLYIFCHQLGLKLSPRISVNQMDHMILRV